MSSKDRGKSSDTPAKTPGQSAGAKDQIAVTDSGGGPKPVRRVFPGPSGAAAAATLRVAMERRAYADLIAHAKESLDREVCGVLAGQVCEDDEGRFVHVEALVRGTAATEASTHVTFTQATWNAIHSALERDYPKLRIVGWYHTHPGFGVEFSDMDLFIQSNFFSGPTQIALVTDPLSGAVAICVNSPQGPTYLPRYWVDGREQPCRVPERTAASRPDTGSAHSQSAVAPIADAAQTLVQLESRMGQLIQAHDELRGSYHRFLFFCGVVFCLAIIGTVSYVVWKLKAARLEPPRMEQYVPMPVQIGDKTVMIGVGIASWEVPPELNSILLQLAREELEAAMAATNAATRTNVTSSGLHKIEGNNRTNSATK